MTVPVQRGDMPTSGDSGVLAYVAQSLQRLEDSVRSGFADVNTHMSRLPELYVPRHEIDRRLDDITGDVDRLTQRMEAAERARVTGRRWALGFSATLAAVLIALLSLILANLPR